MKFFSTFFLIGLLCLSCSNNDAIDCTLFDPAFPELYIRIADATGNNLIENGTVDPDRITVEGDFPGAGFRFIPADEYAEPDSEARALDNTLSLFIPRESKFRYTIHLDDLDPIDVDFTAALTKIPCDLTYFKPIGADSNNKTLEFKEISSLQYLVIIEL